MIKTSLFFLSVSLVAPPSLAMETGSPHPAAPSLEGKSPSVLPAPRPGSDAIPRGGEKESKAPLEPILPGPRSVEALPGINETSGGIPDTPEPHLPLTIFDSLMMSPETQALIQRHEAYLKSLGGAPGHGAALTKEALGTLGALSQIVTILYRQEEFPDYPRSPTCFHLDRRLPNQFVYAEVKVPEHLDIKVKKKNGTSRKIKNIRIIAANPDLPVLKRMYFFQDFFSIRRKRSGPSGMVLQISFHEGKDKHLMGVPSESLCTVLADIFNQDHFIYEQAYMNADRAAPSNYWVGLGYSPETECFYKNTLHPWFVANVMTYTADHPGVRVLELGAGTGQLTMDLFKHLSAAGKEADVLGTELLECNVLGAMDAAKTLVRDDRRTLAFRACDSLELLAPWNSGVWEETEAGNKTYLERHGKRRPLVVVASGAMNRLVLNDPFEASRVLQSLFRKGPDLVLVSGITDTLLSDRIIRKTGFESLFFGPIAPGAEKGYFGYKFKAKTIHDLLARHGARLAADPSNLDLSLSPDPLAILRGLPPERLGQIKSMDVSHAFFMNIVEVEQFLALTVASCPALEHLVHHYGFPADGLLMKEAIGRMAVPETGPAGLPGKITSVPVPAQNLAFSNGFIQRLIEHK